LSQIGDLPDEFSDKNQLDNLNFTVAGKDILQGDEGMKLDMSMIRENV